MRSIRPLSLLTSIWLALFHPSAAFFPPENLLKPQYKPGAPVPVSCLSRDIENGEHITNPKTGGLQYDAFPVCNETSAPLALTYGSSGTTTCTLEALPDTLYHLIEYYVHHDVPLVCRVPAYPLNPLAATSAPKDKEKEQSQSATPESSQGEPGFIPMTIALQGILQLSHLHILTDINVVMHSDGPSSSIIAANAYSVPNPEANWAVSNPTPDQGTKIMRNEPLTFVFRTSWYEGLNLPGPSTSSSAGLIRSSAGLFSVLLLLGVVAAIGGVVAVALDRKKNARGKFGANGILGGNKGGAGSSNGYAWAGSSGSGSGSGSGGGYGYSGGGGRTGFGVGKRD